MNEEPTSFFQVEFTGPAREMLKSLVQEAKALGRLQAFVDCAKAIEDKLHREPDLWGDPVFNLAHLKLPMRRGFLLMLQVDYVLFDEKHVVTVVAVRPMPGWGFSENP